MNQIGDRFFENRPKVRKDEITDIVDKYVDMYYDGKITFSDLKGLMTEEGEEEEVQRMVLEINRIIKQHNHMSKELKTIWYRVSFFIEKHPITEVEVIQETEKFITVVKEKRMARTKKEGKYFAYFEDYADAVDSLKAYHRKKADKYQRIWENHHKMANGYFPQLGI